MENEPDYRNSFLDDDFNAELLRHMKSARYWANLTGLLLAIIAIATLTAIIAAAGGG